MDLWVVAAAAGAGYAAKQNFSANNKESPFGSSIKYSHNFQSESKSLLQQFRDKTCPLRRLAEKTAADDSGTADLLDNRNWGSDDDCNLGLKSRLPSVFSAEEESKSQGSGGTKRGNSIRNRGCQAHPVKALASLNGEGTDDGPCLYPPVSPVRPVLVTDWGGMVRWPVSPVEEFQSKLRKSWSSGDFRQQGSGEGVSAGSSSTSQGHSMILHFATGMVIGILTATIGWNNEVDKLTKLLKQMQSLIQDLQEELEMKEMVMVKELPDEGTTFPVREPIASPSVNEFTKSQMPENSELLSNIEAELQAELETLEQNIKTSAMNRLSNVVELDLDFELDIVQGDLKPAVVNDPPESVDESTDSQTNYSHPPNYSVSPWELSLRLHELIESRLEARIRELEATLSNNQVLDPEPAREFSHSDTDSSSDHETPTCICDERDKREDGPSTENSIDHENPCKASVDWVQDILTSDKQMSIVSNQDSDSEDEESEMLLIKQIVERRRLGSSFKIRDLDRR